MYTIGEVSKMFDIPVSTLRYYDKEDYFPGCGGIPASESSANRKSTRCA